MAAEDCIREIADAAGRELSDSEIDSVLTELDRRRRARKSQGSLESLEDDLLNAADEMAADFEAAAHIERRNELINLRVRADRLSYIDEVDRANGDPSMAIEALNVGVNLPIPRGRLSVGARQQSLEAEYMGGMIADLRRADLLPIVNGGDYDRDIARELAALTKEGVEGTGNRQAKEIAAIIDKYRKASVARENRAGAWIKPLPGYITRQTHDMARIRRAGFDEWFAFIAPKLDEERTFAGADPRTFLKGAWDGLVTGVHLKATGAGETDLKFAFKGPGNLAKRASEHRVLHFADSDGWADYNQRFGTGSLIESVIHDINRAARNTALMETWGTNPRAMFETVMDDLQITHRGDLKKLDRLRRQALRWQFDEIEGLTRIPVSPTLAHIGSTVRAVQSMAKLGGATLSAIPDVVFQAAELGRQRGANPLAQYGDAMSNVVRGMGKGEGRITAELIGVGLEGQIGDIAARFSATDHLPGTMAKLQQRFFKLNLLGPWTDANKRGMGLIMARDLAMHADRKWADLPQADMLARYGMDEGIWNIVRAHVSDAPDGNRYVMPDMDIPDEVLIRALGDKAGKTDATRKRNAQRLRDEIGTMVRSYYVDRVDFAVPTPGARERAILRLGTQGGTPVGEAVRFIMQFKAFPITVLTKVLGPEIFHAGKADVAGLAHVLVATTLMGYLAQSAKEMVKGRSPRDPASADTWSAAFLQGGGAGIYGDFIFGEFNRFGRSLLDTLAGPTLGSIDDLAELWARAIRGEDSAAQGIRLIVQNTPFANLFYTRAAMDYLFLYQVQEMANPGYLQRMERRIERENAQTFVLPPSRAIPFGGGERLLEGVR